MTPPNRQDPSPTICAHTECNRQAVPGQMLCIYCDAAYAGRPSDTDTECPNCDPDSEDYL